MKWRALNYETYEEAVENYKPEERWKVFDGTPEKFNIAHECIDRHKSGVAIRVKFSNGETESYTFKKLSTLSSKFANMLKESGIKKGDRISILLEPCLEFYTAFFGALKAGAVVVICSPLFGYEALKYRIEDSKSKIVIIEKEFEKMIKDITHSLNIEVILKEDLLDIIEDKDNNFEFTTSANDEAIIQYTSGTTGLPKPIVYKHKSLVTFTPTAKFAYGIEEGDRFFCTSPLAWGHGVWGGTLAPLIIGVTTATRSGKFIPEKVLEAIEEFKVNNITLTPTAVRMLLSNQNFEKYEISVEKLTYTGEHMDMDTFWEVREKFGVYPYGLYGSTEYGPILANFAGFKNWKIKPGSLGKPYPGMEVAVIDDDGNVLPPNSLGDIAFKKRGKWVRIGDAGIVDEEGYFWYKGRSDDVIKSSGYRIGPEEVESVINKHPAVLESAVIGKPDKIRGQIVKAFVRLKPEFKPSEELKIEIQEFTKKNLSKYAYPREIEFIEEIPKAMDGSKIRRKELRMRELEKLKGCIYE